MPVSLDVKILRSSCIKNYLIISFIQFILLDFFYRKMKLQVFIKLIHLF